MLLVYIEHSGSNLSKASLVTIAAAIKAKEVHQHEKALGILLGAEGTKAAAESATKYGLDEVLYCEDSRLSNYLACSYAPQIIAAAKAESASSIIALSGTRGKDLMPRVAQALEAGQSSETLEFLAEGKFRRPMYAGNVIADIEITTDKTVATVRSTSFDPAKESGQCTSRTIDFIEPSNLAQEFLKFDTIESERPELTEAEIVVSGGRGMKSEENFKQYIEPLADALGAAIGASRAAVDSGYAPNDWQVGQTGKVVAPKLYLAIGISGAIQHLAGMKDSKTIVAINKDPDAPIFEVADYGLVADLYEAVPELTQKLKN